MLSVHVVESIVFAFLPEREYITLILVFAVRKSVCLSVCRLSVCNVCAPYLTEF